MVVFWFLAFFFSLQDTDGFIAYPGKKDSYFNGGLLTPQRREGKVGSFIETWKSTLIQVFHCGT